MSNKQNIPRTKICTVCGKEYVGYSNARKYCTPCQEVKYKELAKRGWTKHNAKVQALEHSTYQAGKTKCLYCGAWSKAPAMHAYQKHGITAHEYKEAYALPFGKGLLPEYLKEIKRDYVFQNHTVDNLKAGAHMRLKKGEERTYRGVERRLELKQISKLTKKHE